MTTKQPVVKCPICGRPGVIARDLKNTKALVKHIDGCWISIKRADALEKRARIQNAKSKEE